MFARSASINIGQPCHIVMYANIKLMSLQIGSMLANVSQSISTMSTTTLPFSDIQVQVPGFGAMGLSSAMGSDLSYDQAEPVLLKAVERGCTFWDTAVGHSPSSSRRDGKQSII